MEGLLVVAFLPWVTVFSISGKETVFEEGATGNNELTNSMEQSPS
jgi:hypothetical protein